MGTISRRACAFSRAAWGVYGACLWLAFAFIAGADSLTNQAPPAESRLAAHTNLVATYDGGSVSAGDVAEAGEEPRFVADAERNAPPNVTIAQEEKIARHLAATRILVSEARQRGMDQGPVWQVQAKLIEHRVLSETLVEEMRQGVALSEKEVTDFYEANKFKLLTIQAIEARRLGISAQKHGTNALARAKEALALIRAGQDFAAVAERYSDLPTSAAQTSTYPPDFWGKQGAMALAELGEGKVSDPLPAADGFELVGVERMRLPGNVNPEEARYRAREVLAGELAGRRWAEMRSAAEAAFPFVIVLTNLSSATAKPALSTPQPSTNSYLLCCGRFGFTEEECRAFAKERSLAGLDMPKVLAALKENHGEQIQLGEFARGMGLDQRPGFRQRLRYECEKRLAHQAKMVLIPEYTVGLQFPEAQLTNHYQQQWKGTVDARLDYDVLVVPFGVGPEAAAEEREAARTNALAKAQKLIARFWEGPTLEQMAADDSGLQLVTGQSRLFQAGSMLEPLVAGLQPGQIVLEPYEDFGGYCVIRVSKYEASRKTPYEMAKPYITEHFRREAEIDMRQNFELFLLQQKHFKFNPGAAGPASPGTKPLGNSAK